MPQEVAMARVRVQGTQQSQSLLHRTADERFQPIHDTTLLEVPHPTNVNGHPSRGALVRYSSPRITRSRGLQPQGSSH